MMLPWNSKSCFERNIIALGDNDKCRRGQEHSIRPYEPENRSSLESMLDIMAVSLQVHTGEHSGQSKQSSSK